MLTEEILKNATYPRSYHLCAHDHVGEEEDPKAQEQIAHEITVDQGEIMEDEDNRSA